MDDRLYQGPHDTRATLKLSLLSMNIIPTPTGCDEIEDQDLRTVITPVKSGLM